MAYDLIVHNGTIITVNAAFDIIKNGAVCIKKGRIDRVEKNLSHADLSDALELLDAHGGIVMPGLVNVHTHLPMTLLRGLADDMPLLKWLNEHIFPAERRCMNAETVHLGTLVGCAEMIFSGTTTCCDGYFYEDAVAEAVRESGMRAVLGQGVIDYPAPGVADPSKNIRHAEAFVEKWLKASPLISPSIFCHSPYTCSPETLQKAKCATGSRGLVFQIHIAETRDERERFLNEHRLSPVCYLEQLGVIDEKTLLVHAIWLDEGDIGIIAKHGAKIAHNPESNMKLGSGIAPVLEFLTAGIPVGLGTDGCASNNNLDLFQEMDVAAKLHKVHTYDPTAMDAETVIRMATIMGARALGLEEETGSIEVGKQADLIVLDTQKPHLVPMYHPASQIVYAACGSDVRDVVVAGRRILKDRNLITLDVKEILQKAAAFGKTMHHVPSNSVRANML
jgi:5-methylthioadenosine/S-adenosylhomocysteine deaminase